MLSEEAEKAFETLKSEPTNMDNVLSLPDFELPFILETDASDECIGAALMQRIEGKDLPIAFFSRAMTSAEKKHDTSQKELLALIKSVEHFKQFLYGKEFVIKTDHHPLTSITTKSKPSVRLGRWLSELADYQFKIEHKKSAVNILADALSRLNLPNDEEEDLTYVEKIINSVGLKFDPEIEILEFGEMIGAMASVGE